MGKIQISFLGAGLLGGLSFFGRTGELDVTNVAWAGTDRVRAPLTGFARVSVRSDDVLVAVGADPLASAGGVRVDLLHPQDIPVVKGDLISVVLAPSASAGGSVPTLTYDAGTLTASGGAPAGATVVVRIDGQSAGSVTADSAGRWTLVLGVAPAAGAVITALVTSTTSPVTAPAAGGSPTAPTGFQLLQGADGALLLAPSDGAPLYGIAA